MENFMTVEQLIAKLQKCDPKAIVAKTTDNFEQGNNDVPATGVYEKTYNKEIKSSNYICRPG